MRLLYFLIAFLLYSQVACHKYNNCNCPATEVCATIVKIPANCDNFGIETGGQSYPALNIPSAYQQVGKKVCVSFELYQDTRLCVCCGGTWADIKSIH
jgi:hypothetical protein